jgi:nucleoside-diphosphate-sugar epimerase
VKILVTGARGFLGTRVMAALAGGADEVIGLGRPHGPAAASGAAAFVACDLADTPRLTGVLRELRPEAIVHLAWFTAHGAYWSAPENLGCVATGLALIRLAAEHGCRRFVGAGTCAEYDWRHAELVERTTPCVPHTLYGAAKLGLFLVAERFAQTAGISLAWARYGFLFGPDEAAGRLVTGAIRSLAAGTDFACSAGTQVRDFVHVDEAAAATAALVRGDATGPVNIGSGEPMAVRRIVATIAELVGGRAVPRFGALPTRPDDPPALVLDLTRLHGEVGWRPRRSLRDALADTVERVRGEGRS